MTPTDAGIASIATLTPIDTLSVAGIILGNNHRIVAVDQLGWDFLNYVQDGQAVDGKEHDTVTVQ